jgi:hypothetical protein
MRRLLLSLVAALVAMVMVAKKSFAVVGECCGVMLPDA